MGHKAHPKSLRLGIIENWNSRWFNAKNYRQFLEEDSVIRDVIEERLRTAGIDAVEIERSGQNTKVTIRSARPGIIIGRSGKGIDDLRIAMEKALGKVRRKNKTAKPTKLSVEVEEVRRSDVSARVVAQTIAQDIEKRLRFRRIMKDQIEKMMQNKEVKGAKVRLSGRLDGAEIARTEWLAEGKIPLHTLRSKIDYGESTAYCTYGAVGIKVWIYKGDQFADKA